MPVTVISTWVRHEWDWLLSFMAVRGLVWETGVYAARTPGQEQHKGSLWQGHGRGQDRLGSQKGLPRRNNVRPASGGVVVDGKGVRVFLLEKEQTTEGMLSKGIIYLEMRELGAPGAQGVYVEAVQVRLWGPAMPCRTWVLVWTWVLGNGEAGPGLIGVPEVHSGSSEEDILESCSELRWLFRKQVVRRDNSPSINLLSATP